MKCDTWLHIYSVKHGTTVLCDEVADVRENVRGEWIEITNETVEWYWHSSKCSVCDAEMLLSFDNFCPNCGADMRGEEK